MVWGLLSVTWAISSKTTSAYNLQPATLVAGCAHRGYTCKSERTHRQHSSQLRGLPPAWESAAGAWE